MRLTQPSLVTLGKTKMKINLEQKIRIFILAIRLLLFWSAIRINNPYQADLLKDRLRFLQISPASGYMVQTRCS